MRTEAIGFARRSADNPNVLEGLAVPYGVVSRPTELLPGSGQIVREAWAPGAFSADVAAWGARVDGRKSPFRPRHGERPIGVTEWTDTPEGVAHRTTIFDTPRGRDYLTEVDAGINGVSVEGMWNETPRKLRDGTLLHRSGKLMALAGSDMPAFDTAHIARRDMEDETVGDEAITTPEVAVAPAPEAPAPITPAQAVERDATLAQIIQTGASIRQTRPEPIYGPRTGVSFFRDQIASREGDVLAAERQAKYGQLLADQAQIFERAGDVISSEIPGALPNDYLPGLLTPRILKGRPMAGFFNHVAINDARPRIFPKVTTSTSVAVQAAEGTNPAASDLATTAVTVTPALYGGHTVVSRQVLDGADPSIDQMLMQDLLEAYAQASEAVVVTAVEAGAAASGTAITAATPFAGTLGNVVKYQTTRFSPAEGMMYPAALYAVLLAQGDSTGRPFLPSIGPWNSDGTTRAGATGANLLGSDILLSWGSTANVVVTARRADYVIYESSIATFRYDQTSGPAGIDIGLWAYLGVGTRLGALKVTAA